jgi:hypothetical protein
MCSTQADVYGKEDPDDPAKGTEVPGLPLLEKLASESALVRSDQIPITVDKKKIDPKVAAPLPPSPPGTRWKRVHLGWIVISNATLVRISRALVPRFFRICFSRFLARFDCFYRWIEPGQKQHTGCRE